MSVRRRRSRRRRRKGAGEEGNQDEGRREEQRREEKAGRTGQEFVSIFERSEEVVWEHIIEPMGAVQR